MCLPIYVQMWFWSQSSWIWLNSNLANNCIRFVFPWKLCFLHINWTNEIAGGGWWMLVCIDRISIFKIYFQLQYIHLIKFIYKQTLLQCTPLLYRCISSESNNACHDTIRYNIKDLLVPFFILHFPFVLNPFFSF